MIFIYTQARKYACFLLLVWWVTISIPSGAQDKFSPLTAKVSYTAKAANAAALLQVLQQQTGYTFSFNKAEMTAITLHNLEYKDVPLGNVLRQLRDREGLSFLITGRNIAVIKDNTIKRQLPPQATEKGVIKGRVVDFETTQPMPGATVQLAETGTVALADEKGYYEFKNLSAGKYTLRASFIGYQHNILPGIVLADGKTVISDVKMEGGRSLSEVVVTSGPRQLKAVTHTTDKQLISEIRTANSVVTGISSEQISKMADRNAAQVIQRTSGVTIRDDKFPVIRGMDPRYNVIYLNDNIAPSTELYSRAFAMDLIPSRILDRIMIYKSPAPDIYGDMSGGAVKIYTKDAKSVKHLDIEIVASDHVGTSFKPLLTYAGGKYDYLGFDDGTRKLPAGVPGFGDLHKASLTQQQYVQNFSPILQYRYKTALPDLQATLNAYNSFRIGKAGISSLTALNYRYEAQRNDIYTQTGNTNTLPHGYGYDKIGSEDQNIENTQMNLLQNFSMKLKDSSKLYFRNFLLEDASKSVVVRLNHDNVLPTAGPLNYFTAMRKDNILSFTQRFLYAGNLGGIHYLRRRQRLKWNLGYTYSRQDIPDQRVIRLQHRTTTMYPDVYTMPDGVARAAEGTGLGWEPYYRGQSSEVDYQPTYGMITRLWLKNMEGVYNATADYDVRLRSWMTLKAGTFQQWKERKVYRKQFKVNDGQEQLSSYPPGYYSYADWSRIGFKEQDLSKVWSNDYLRDDGTALKVYDNTQTQDSYIATEQLNAGYLALLAQPANSRLDIYGGLRVEYDRQKLAAAPGDVSGTTPILVNRPVWSWLPSLNISYHPADDLIVRTAYGRSVNRPEFREISPFSNLDFISNELIFGNPLLVSARLDNFDLRAEWYPKSSRQDEMITIGGFYKALKNPIERIRKQAAVGEDLTTISFQNADKGTLYGLEAELHKNLGFIPGRFFRNLYIIANGALIHSEITVQDTVRLGGYQSNGYKRPLQGQAPYTANVGLFYDNAGTGTRASLSYNVAGTRIYAVGYFEPLGGSISQSVYRGSILELPRHLVDFSITQRIVRSLQVKLSIQNLLNEAVTYVEDNNFNYKYDKEKLTPLYRSDGSPLLNPDGSQQTAYKGDNIFRKYYPNKYIRATFTYSF
ncbi:TonB-dependent receptor [Chitinophaga vietnamensis]|uniref:TonB-dependent receptor n=1 Tax=Chitinophaga vietnamensis TaxID=2593957 RepID=UPI001177837E|nr:TonB-dependent receptor [Chitinophaga vietnamensis]